MALLINAENEEPVEIGILLLIPPAYTQGYFWRPGQEQATFCSHPKKLPNDVVWITNAPYDNIGQAGRYFKDDKFFRVPLMELIHEISPANDSLRNLQSVDMGRMIVDLQNGPEAKFIREATHLRAAWNSFAKPMLPRVHPDWRALGEEAQSYTWGRVMRNKLLLTGKLAAPRFDFSFQLMQCPLPDTSQEPMLIKAQASNFDAIKDIVEGREGFVRVSVEGISSTIQNFTSLDKTLMTVPQVLWLSKRAKVTTRAFFLADPVKHPLLWTPPMEQLSPLSWVDGLRLEAMCLAPGLRATNAAWETYLRTYGNLSSALMAEYLTTVHNISCSQLNFHSISVSYSSRERAELSRNALMSGMIPLLREGEE